MTVTVNPVDQHKVTLHIEVPVEDVEKGAKKAYQRLANQVNIKGFRKGKAPKFVIDSFLGKEAVKEEIFNIVASEAYDKALAQEGIVPVSNPDVNIISQEDGQPLVFDITITKKPEVTLGEYKGLKVEKEAVEVTDEMVEKQLEGIRTKHAKMVVAEGAALEKGDFAVIDFAGTIDGVPFDGGEGKSYPLEIGSGSFIPGFEDQLIGAKAGEERVVKVEFPKDYFAEKLAGKAAEFKVNIIDVKRRELPELTDEFVKENSAYETVEAMTADLRKKLEEDAKRRAQEAFNAAVIKLAVENATVDVPEIMVEDKIDQMIQEFAMNLESRHMKLEDYLKYSGQDMEAFRANYKETAAANTKTDLVLDAIAKAEEVKVTTEDMNFEIMTMAHNFGADPKEVWNIITKENRVSMLASTVARKKAASLIITSAMGAEEKAEEAKEEQAE